MTNKVASIELHKAINLALKGNYRVTEVKSLNPNFPFIEIGEFIELDTLNKTNNRPLFHATIHTFSRSQNSIESKQMNEFVKDKIMNLSNVQGFNVDMTKLDNIFTLKEIEEQKETVFHGVLQIEIQLTEETRNK